MKKQLFLLRHAKTKQAEGNEIDFNRSLLPKGIKQIEVLATYFKENKYELPPAFVSKAKRTQETFQLLSTQFSIELAGSSQDLYLASRSEILAFIQQQSGNQLFIVGHNEGLSDLASYLCETPIHLQTCGFVQLEVLVDDWNLLSAGTCLVKEHFRPEV